MVFSMRIVTIYWDLGHRLELVETYKARSATIINTLHLDLEKAVDEMS